MCFIQITSLHLLSLFPSVWETEKCITWYITVSLDSQMDQWKITNYHGRTIYKNCLFKYMSTMPTGQGFPGSSEGKESGRHGFDSWVRKIPWRRARRPTPVFLPGESHGQSSLGYKSMGSQRLTEPTNTHTHAYRSENPEDLKEAFLLKCPVPQAYKIPQTYET